MLPSLRNFAITFIVSAIVFGALAFLFTEFAMDSFGGGFVNGDKTTTDTEEETVGVFNPFDDPKNNGNSTILGNSFNFLLVGIDYQEEVFGDYDENMREYLDAALAGKQDPTLAQTLSYKQKRAISADAILVGRVDKEDKRIVLTALSGNTRVYVDGVHTTLGSVLFDKGLDFFRGKVTAITGLSIDYYGVVSIPNMIKIIDRLGGLSFKVPCDMQYEDPIEGLTISLTAGKQWLSGEQALGVLRYVSYEDLDISRMTVLRDMASSMITSAANITTLEKAPELYKDLKDGVVTNFSLADFTDRLDLLFKLGDFSVVNYAYPGEMRIDGGITYFIPDTSAAISALAPYKS